MVKLINLSLFYYLSVELVQISGVLGCQNKSELSVEQTQVVQLNSQQTLNVSIINLELLIQLEVQGITRISH